MPPLASIIIPCYNSGRWLAATLDSALAQSWPRIEIIVVDDGSLDDSLAVARNYESRNVRVIAQPNQGASAARNAGLRAARGDFIQFLDADDLLAPEKIEQQIRLLSPGEFLLASGTWTRFQDDPNKASFGQEAVYAARTGVEFLILHYETGSMMQPAAWLAARSLLDRAGPWDESLSLNDDGEYFARVMLAAGSITHCPSARVYYRSGLANTLSGRTDRRALESLHRSVELTTAHLLAAEHSPLTRAACAHAWKKLAFEIYPQLPGLAADAEIRMRSLGGSTLPFPAGQSFNRIARIIGWRQAKRLRTWLARRTIAR